MLAVGSLFTGINLFPNKVKFLEYNRIRVAPSPAVQTGKSGKPNISGTWDIIDPAVLIMLTLMSCLREATLFFQDFLNHFLQ